MAESGAAAWTQEQANNWYNGLGEVHGCNYLPRTAVNSTEMWLADSFDPTVIDEELGWAEEIGINSIRVFLQYMVWADDARGILDRFCRVLELAGRHSISVAPVLFCDCSFAGKEPYLGKQDDPIPGVHNSGWVPSPGLLRVENRGEWPRLEQYVKSVVGEFGSDDRILMWDLYNEPGNSNMGVRSLPLVEATFGWARTASPIQPLTTGAWTEFRSEMSTRIFEMSDVISFHAYDNPDAVRAKVNIASDYRRPMFCTEWLHRQSGNTFEHIMPIWRAHNVGWYVWGLVAGRTQTYCHWEAQPGTPVPEVWQHDLLHPDGTPYDSREITYVRCAL